MNDENNFDLDLNFSKKYNWWTKEEDKNNISITTKLSYVLSNKNMMEYGYIFKNFSYDLLWVMLN